MKVADSISQAYEAKLVERLRADDAAAAKEFYLTYRDKLYSFVFGRVGRDPSVAEDLVHEIFLAALNSLDRFRCDSQLYTWLCGIAYHKIADFHRDQVRRAKRGELPLSSETLELERIGDTEPIASSMTEYEEARYIVQQALLRLPVDYRQVLTFKYIEEMPVLGISEVMGRSPKSVEGLLSRARKALRASLKEVDKSD